MESRTDPPTVSDFHQGLLQCLPHLRAFSRFLARDPSFSDDLVQETVMRALAARNQFQTGTSLKAWLFAIQRNLFYESHRKTVREQAVMADYSQAAGYQAPECLPHTHQDSIRELGTLLWKLPDVLREALILVGAQELPYDVAAHICGVPVGTMKARVSRARAALERLNQGPVDTKKVPHR